MLRIEKAALLSVLIGVVSCLPAKAADNVRVESKIFQIGHPTCTVGVYISNDLPASGLILALEMRTVTGGAFIAQGVTPTTFKWEENAPDSRVRNSPLGSVAGANWPSASVTLRKYAVVAGTCSDPSGNWSTTNTYTTAVANPDGTSPDGFLLATVSQGDQGIGEDVELAAGSDPDGTASYRFVFPANMSPGTFVIDSCCVAPANVNAYTDIATAIYYMSMTEGTITLVPSAVKELETGVIPQDYSLEQNYPNPFNPATVIAFSLSEPGDISLEVFDILGRRVVTLANGARDAGIHRVVWDGQSEQGEPVASGMYFYRLQTSRFTQTRKMLLLK